MNLTLWLVLAGVVGLAMLVTYEKRRCLRVPLSGPQIIGRLHVSLPANWKIKSTGSLPEGGDFVYAEESAPEGEPPRKLSIERRPVGQLVSPMEHLFRAELLSEKDLSGVGRGERPTVQNILLAGYPGRLVTQTFPVASQRGPVKKQLLACAVLPSAQALVIKLEGAGEADAADEELVRQMAETVAVMQVDPPPAAGGRVTLGEGIVLDAPANFLVLPNTDPNRVSIQLLADGSSDSWTAIELISCLFFPEDAEDAIATMLVAHDHDWEVMVPRQLGAQLWQVERANNKSFPGRAYLLANGDNQAVLAVFRGGFHDAAGFNAAWAAIAPSIRFTTTPDYAAMLQCGAEQARQLAEAGLAALLLPAGGQQWSRWDEGENLDKRLWMRQTWNGPTLAQEGNPPWQGRRRTVAADPYGGVIERRSAWNASDDLKNYSATSASFAEEGGALGHGDLWTEFPEHRVTLAAGRLKIELPRNNSDAFPVPAQYIPGGPLPMLLGKLALEGRTAILRTESFVGSEGPLPGLLILFVANATDGPVKPDETGRAMDCLSVQVNGSGRLSRWYFANGVLRYIDQAGGLHAMQGGSD